MHSLCRRRLTSQNQAIDSLRMLMIVQSQQSVKEEPAADKTSIWDWTPPGDLAETGAWKVLRELAMTLSKYVCSPAMLVCDVLNTAIQACTQCPQAHCPSDIFAFLWGTATAESLPAYVCSMHALQIHSPG